MSDTRTAMQIGEWIGGFLPLVIGIGVSLYLRKRRGGERLPGWPIITGLVLSLLTCFGATNQSGQRASATTAENDLIVQESTTGPTRLRSVTVNSAVNDLIVETRATGPASNFTDDFSPQYLRAYEKSLRDSTIDLLNRNGANLRQQDLRVESSHITIAGNNVVRTKVFAPSLMFFYQFAGVSGANVVNVMCRRQSFQPFELSGSECEKRANEVFARGERG